MAKDYARTRWVKDTFQWLDEDGNVIAEDPGARRFTRIEGSMSFYFEDGKIVGTKIINNKPVAISEEEVLASLHPRARETVERMREQQGQG